LTKKLLVAGASYGDIPVIKEAKKLGYYVITAGNREKDLGHSYSDEHYLVDFSDKEAIYDLSKELSIDYIVPSCHDLSMITCSYVAEKLSLPGYDSYETTQNLHHKDKFRKISNEYNLMVPNAKYFDNINKAKVAMNSIYLPCIIKPIDLGGGKGISVVSEEKDLKLAIENAFKYSKLKKIVIEDYVEGTLHSFSCFIDDKKVIFYFADNEFSSVNPYGVSLSSSPSNNFDLVRSILIEQTEKIAEIYNLSNGLLHLQYLRNTQDITIIEFTRRTPGDWYGTPVRLSTGINYEYWVLQGFLNKSFSTFNSQKQNGFYSRYCLMSRQNGKIIDLVVDKSIEKNILNRFCWFQKGDMINDFKYQKFGLFFLKFENLNEMKNFVELATNLIKLEVE